MKIHLRIGEFEVSTIALILLVIAFFGFWYISVYERAIVNSDSENESIVLFGDSLAQGVGALQNGGLAGVLGRELDTPIENLGVSGDTVSDAWARIDSVLKLNPRIVIISLGENDFLQKIPQQEVESRYKRIIATLHENGSAVIILGMPVYKEMYRELAREYGTEYVSNILRDIITRPEYMFDEIHPNDRGYEKIASKIKPKLIALLKQ